jgi:hypothetical protein
MGTIAAGLACGDDAQCDTGRCRKAQDSTCGVCGPRAAAGDACQASDDCAYQLDCTTGGHCAAFVALSGSCDADHPCAPPLACKTGSCAVASGPGGPCARNGDCDGTQGLFCNPLTSVCQLAAIVIPGLPCGAVNGGYALCARSGVCRMSGSTGTCVAPAADGAACDTTAGPACVPPAICTTGVCKLPDPASCG